MLFSFSEMLIFLFLSSSRRRHTRSKRDWSSDVCSSDLPKGSSVLFQITSTDVVHGFNVDGTNANMMVEPGHISRDEVKLNSPGRSEERRVGKECRCRWWQKPEKKKRE